MQTNTIAHTNVFRDCARSSVSQLCYVCASSGFSVNQIFENEHSEKATGSIIYTEMPALISEVKACPPGHKETN